MKGIVIFYSDRNSEFADEKVFNNQSGRQLAKLWAESLKFEAVTVTAENLTQLLSAMVQACTENNADYVIFSYDDLPFLDTKLTQDLINTHTNYKSEYTFADGYPYGFTPELIDKGTLGILLALSKTNQKTLGEAPVSRDGIYNLIKTDINSFEVEAELAPNDWRLYRFAFHCGKKENFMQTTALFQQIKNQTELSADEKSCIASKTLGCLKTVPGFYNLQIADKVNSNYIYLPYDTAYSQKNGTSCLQAKGFMAYEQFAALVDKIAEFSHQAVISLSAWGEPLLHPDCLKMIEKILSYEGLSVFIETDGLSADDDFCEKLGQIVSAAKNRTNGWQKIMAAVSLDAFTSETYAKLHKGSQAGDFEKAVACVAKLQSVIPGMVYPQLVRINENENELEGFYRYWSEKTNPSGGNLIIQKYDDFAGLLPDWKPADLSPLEKHPCWHARRDMTILSNGDVPSCRACVLDGVVGNAFTEDLEKLWHKNDSIILNQIENKFLDKCERCDEFYTFNF